MFPFYMRFHGGKGFAAYLGMTLALNWRFALLLLLAVSLITLVTDYVVLGTMTTVISVPLYSAWSGSGTTALLLLPLSAIIIYKHRDNLVRICRGTEIGCAAPTAETTAKARRADHRAVGAFARRSAAAIQKASEKGASALFPDAFFVSFRAAVSLSARRVQRPADDAPAVLPRVQEQSDGVRAVRQEGDPRAVRERWK